MCCPYAFLVLVFVTTSLSLSLFLKIVNVLSLFNVYIKLCFSNVLIIKFVLEVVCLYKKLFLSRQNLLASRQPHAYDMTKTKLDPTDQTKRFQKLPDATRKSQV